MCICLFHTFLKILCLYPLSSELTSTPASIPLLSSASSADFKTDWILEDVAEK